MVTARVDDLPCYTTFLFFGHYSNLQFIFLLILLILFYYELVHLPRYLTFFMHSTFVNKHMHLDLQN